MTFCNRVPVQGVLQKSKFASWRPWRALFLCSPQCVGIALFLWISEVPCENALDSSCGPKSVFGKIYFSRPPLRKCTLFLLGNSSAGMGTIIFHQNHRNSFGVTNSNMKTLARSKIDSFLKQNLILYYKIKGLVACKVSATVSFSRCSIYLNAIRQQFVHGEFSCVLSRPACLLVNIRKSTGFT